VDTTKVPLLATANTFTAKQTISSGDLVVANGSIDLPLTTNASAGVINMGTNTLLHACCGSNENLFIGGAAGNFTNTGGNDTAVGFLALKALTTGSNDTAIGWGSLNVNNSGNDNTAVGGLALGDNLSGSSNTAIGEFALLVNTTGSNNTGTGAYALQYNVGSENTATGADSLLNNTTGFENSAFGLYALWGNVTGNENTAIGYSAGRISTGSYDTFLGAEANVGIQTGLTNATAVGAQAQVTASNSLVLGSIAGVNRATASTNVGIGTTAPAERLDLGNDGNVVIRTDPGADNIPDAVAYELIGRGTGGVPDKWSIYTAPVGGGFGVPANSLSIWEYPPSSGGGCCLQRFVILPSGPGDTGSTVSIDGSGNAQFPGCIYYNGGSWGICTSDVRLKKDIRPYSSVLDRLVQLQPVSYNWRREEFPQFHFSASRSSGLIAQEVEKVFPEMVEVGNDGFKRVKYGELPYLMLQAIRELKAENDSLREKLKANQEQQLAAQSKQRQEDREDFRAELAQLRAEVDRLTAVVQTGTRSTVPANLSAASIQTTSVKQ